MKSVFTICLLCLASVSTMLACVGFIVPSDVCEVRTYDTSNDLDWTQPSFTYYKLVSGSTIQSSLTSPFHEPPGNIPNVFAFSAPLAKDYAFDEGWRYVMHKFGTPTQGIANPWFILYNIHSGTLRIFIAIDEVLDDKQHAQISLSWWSDTKTAALEHYSGNNYCHVLEYFSDGAGKEPNVFVNTTSPPFWLHADFVMHYDPCTCNYNSQLRFEAFLVEQSDLAFTLAGELNQVDLNADDAGMIGTNNATGTLAKSQSAIDNYVGGIKSIGSGVGTLGKIFTAAQPGKPATAATYDALGNVITLAKPAVPAIPAGSINSIGDVVNLFLGGGSIISGAVKLFGLLIGSSPAPTSPAPPPKPLKFKVDMTAEGQITSSSSYVDVAFENPGADHEGFVEGFIPHYDNVMGVFNIIKANYRIEQSLVFYPDIIFPLDAWRLSLVEPIQYALNPNAEINYLETDLDANYIKAAWEFTAPNGKVFTSDFYDLNCFVDYRPYWDLNSLFTENGGLIEGDPQNFFDETMLNTVRIKIMAMFTTKNGIKIPYVNRFKPTLTEYTGAEFGPPGSPSPGGTIFPPSSCSVPTGGLPNYPHRATIDIVSAACNSTVYQQKSGQQLMEDDPDQVAAAAGEEEDEFDPASEHELNYDEMVVFPNPTTTKGYFTLRYGLEEEGPITISIYDMRGTLITVALQADHHYPGIYDIGVTLPDNVTPGTYFIIKETGKGISKGTLVIQ